MSPCVAVKYHLPDLLHITGIGQASMGSSLGAAPPSPPPQGPAAHPQGGSDILDRASHDLRLEKSNILLLGPTGCGES